MELVPTLTFMSNYGHLYTIKRLNYLNFTVSYVAHPDQLRVWPTTFTRPISLFEQWLDEDKLRQISGPQDLSTKKIIDKWHQISSQDYSFCRGLRW